MSFLSRAPLFLILLLIAFPIYGISPLDVVINEIAWMGTKIEGIESRYWWQYEWIELYNNLDQEIEISGWKIINGKSKNGILEISTAKIPQKSYFLICKKELKNCDLKNWTLSLNNVYRENGSLILMDKNGNIIDQSPETSDEKWPAGDNLTKKTMERKNSNLPGSDSNNWQTSNISGGTPKSENSKSDIENLKNQNLENIKMENIEASISKQISKKSIFIFLIAFSTSILSAVIILVMKTKIQDLIIKRKTLK